MKLLSMRTENFMRCVFADVMFDQDVVTIAGNNGEGKSSFAKSIWALFGGKDAIPEKPVTEGAEISVLHAELDGDFVLTRIIYPDRTTKLELRNKDGGKYSSAQSILDGFNLRFGFWPQKFINDEPKVQADVLRKVVGLDFTKEDMKIKSLAEERTIVGRELKQLQGQYQGMPAYSDVPEAIVSVDELMLELKNAHKQQAQIAALHRVVKDQTNIGARKVTEIEDAKMAILKLQEQINKLEIEVKDHEVEVAKAKKLLAESVAPNIEAIESRISDAEISNQKFREAQEREKVRLAGVAKRVEYDKLEESIAGINADKEKALLNAKFPVSGLGFGENGVTFLGQPFSQASTAQQWEVAVAIGFMLNPELKLVYIEQGSLLDEKTMARVRDIVEQNGGQLLVEIVGKGDERAIVFEDGIAAARVKANGVHRESENQSLGIEADS